MGAVKGSIVLAILLPAALPFITRPAITKHQIQKAGKVLQHFIFDFNLDRLQGDSDPLPAGAFVEPEGYCILARMEGKADLFAPRLRREPLQDPAQAERSGQAVGGGAATSRGAVAVDTNENFGTLLHVFALWLG